MRVSAFSFLLDEIDDEAGDPPTLFTHAWRAGVRGVGRTAPNPAVGAAVALAEGRIVEGHHARAGDRHAEVVALDAVAAESPDAARGATLACTLEPCVHHGRTPPCVDRILKDGVARVVVGALDENPVVRGQGVARLRASGVVVEMATGIDGARAQALAAPFFTAVTKRRPYVVLKIAASLDGRIATSNGASRWITGPPARALVHRLRDRVDAVMVGAGTVLADDPALTARDVPAVDPRRDGPPRDPVRVILDPRGRVPPSARALTGGALVLRRDGAAATLPSGVDVVGVPPRGESIDLAAGLGLLHARGIHTVLVEAGPGLATALLNAHVVDELWWIQAPMALGADGVPALGPLGLEQPDDATRWAPLHMCAVGDDVVRVLGRTGP